jgi:hypothetical protein
MPPWPMSPMVWPRWADVRPAIFDGASEARSAAFCLTAMEGAACTGPI